MLRSMSTVLGVGLLVLWIVGLGSATAPGWMTWLDGFAALCAFGIAAYVTPYTRGRSRSAMPIALAGGLFILWLVGMSKGVVPWMNWWNFAFACAFLGLGIYSSLEQRPIRAVRTEVGPIEKRRVPSEVEEDRTRRSA